MKVSKQKKRARDLGIPFDGVTGSFNAITDVAGVEVGYTTIKRGAGSLQPGKGPVCTGVTAILPRGKDTIPRPVVAGIHAFNGNGEMTGSHWVEDSGAFIGPVCLTNTHSVGIVHHAACQWICRTYATHYIDDHGWAMPIVAETYDGLTNDIVGQHVTAEDASNAIETAAGGFVAEGNVGGGTGMMTYEFKGGSGTASRMITLQDRVFTLAAFVQSNFGRREELTIRGVRVGRAMPEDAPLTRMSQPETGSIIVVIATDAPLAPHQLKRLAKRGALGIGRSGTSGGHYSGDILLAFSTANDFPLPAFSGEHPVTRKIEILDEHYLDSVYTAAVESVEEAIINALVAAETTPIIKPGGLEFRAIDHARLQDMFSQ